MLLDKIESTGIKLAVVEDGLQITGEVTDQQLDYLRSHKQQLIDELMMRRFKPHCVTCIDCVHFVRSSHPHLGRCNAGVNQSAPAGFWDTHLRGCGKYTEAIG